jgi:hypothetical protein
MFHKQWLRENLQDIQEDRTFCLQLKDRLKNSMDAELQALFTEINILQLEIIAELGGQIINESDPF